MCHGCLLFPHLGCLGGGDNYSDSGGNHPFYVSGQGWLDTVELKPNMELVDSHQNHLKVMNVQPVKEIETTYNLTVLDNHTFYVGEDKVWVHNAGKSCDCSVTTKAPVSSRNPDDLLSDKAKLKPSPLTKDEFTKVANWTEVRLKYLDYVKGTDLNLVSDELLRGQISRARNSIIKSMTPDDMAAVLKENRGIKIPDPNNPGKYYDHIQEAEGARNSIINAIRGKKDNKGRLSRGIQSGLINLQVSGKYNSAEYKMLQNELSHLSKLLDFYEKQIGHK